MKAIVISGGGCKGAFAGGIAEHLILNEGRDYDIYSGTSTGSLLMPFLAAGEIERIKQVYTTVSQEDIFDVCPFILKRKNGTLKASFNHFAIIKQFIRRRKTFGESNNLRSLIRNTLTKETFETLHRGDKYVISTVANLSLNIIEHKYLRDCSYEEYCDWIWISANMVPFMTLAERNGYEYGDGGFGNLIPIQEAINLGAKEIDVIILTPRHTIQSSPKAQNVVALLMRAFNFMLYQIGQDDLKMSLLESRYNDLKIRIFHTPRILTDNAVVFDPAEMKAWWEEGRQYAEQAFHS